MKIFHLEKCFKHIFRTHRTIQNFPKIPKITLIKSRDHFKDTKNPNYESPILIYWIFDDLRILLCGATLDIIVIPLVFGKERAPRGKEAAF